MVIWITGLSASGKTTLSRAFEKKVKGSVPNMVLLDGDIVRQLYGDDLGYEESDRYKQITRIQNLATFLEKQSIVVVVAALYSHPDLLKQNRNNFKQYFEVYLHASIGVLQKREFKGLYQKALNKEILNVVGVDIPWNTPVEPDMVFELSDNLSPELMADKLIERLPDLKNSWE